MKGESMAYDLDKYRDKRERVLGVRKRGLGFGTVVAGVAFFILLGLGWVVVPRAVLFLQNRQLEDAIYKLSGAPAELGFALGELEKQRGVRAVTLDGNGARAVVTFNREILDAARISAYLERHGIQAALLNEIGHEHRMHLMKKEAGGR